ncbi:pyridoxamine 5'-phosphate oxidase family protein [Streptomyces sp. AC536]|uniref:pyridoxamine 5'-phosphate oxidase family protein n=1 Tax=Streptomyces buecherae TaxID=2763006 RepID=UPI00164D3431|nr:pyridoxamine 5'-phosphate oxidase family protein [Streptomyces buecherae]MBC3985793.1 pyridoxamine 5'-phosphate oxidase family protein [Streptomyces buecherae]QNJ42591.1 pyridoxamine 5'-phosphate oxidase family protein [Streptomyces buecherae]
MSRYAHLAYTDSVRRVQREQGSASAAARALARPGAEEGAADPIGAQEAAFIASRDGFYLGSVSETGWPYVQYRGGPPGFLHVLDEGTLGYADVRGNRQYISTGNVRANGRVALFLMDYARQARLKIFGRAEIRALDEHPALAERLGRVRTDGRVERLVTIRVEGFNWNCPQHITPRFTQSELVSALPTVRAHIAEVEGENERLLAAHAELTRRNAALEQRNAALDEEVRTLRARVAATGG